MLIYPPYINFTYPYMYFVVYGTPAFTKTIICLFVLSTYANGHFKFIFKVAKEARAAHHQPEINHTTQDVMLYSHT